ncbi:MAG: hypothetical protein EP330_04560 [Deltaproteobacteria bacterium]|nr:MAG: hypothetical protein EP330_04560 [Deltaproteobacteria bacterium]
MKTLRRASSAISAPSSQDVDSGEEVHENGSAQEQLEAQGQSTGPFDSPLLNAALEASFGQSLSGLSADWASAENEAIGADASCEGSAMSFGGSISENAADTASMEIVGHEVAHALAGGGSGETVLDTENDQGEDKADEAGVRFAEWASAGFEGPAPELKAATGGKAAIHRHGGATLSGRPMLRRGSRGGEVSALQSLLNALGHALSVDGIFGRRTESAVLAYQRSKRLEIDGIVGPNTASSLNGAHAGTHSGSGQGSQSGQSGQSTQAGVTGRPELRLGRRGTLVEALQRLLNTKGGSLRVDGDFGPATDNAVKRFQAANNLEVDGVVGPNTAAKLNDGSSNDLTSGNANGGQGNQPFAGNEAYENLRDAVMAAAESHLGKPYYWGADGPSMFDCSGFVLYVLRQETGLINWGDDTAAGISNRLPKTTTPKRGDCVFYRGRSGISHIEFSTGNGSETLGASGGGPSTKGDNPRAKVKFGNYNRDSRAKSFGSIEGLIQAKLSGGR